MYLIVSIPDLCTINYFAQGHNDVTPVKLEPAASRSQVKHSTTEPLRSHSVNVAYIRVPSIYQNIFISETTMPIERKFHLKTSDKSAKMYTNCFVHMTKLAATPING